MAEYDVFAVCNACGDLHPLGISVRLADGPAKKKQSIADAYQGQDLPPSLAALKDSRVYCPKTGRQYSQKDTNKIFLMPRG
jgi:hypothetical protein